MNATRQAGTTLVELLCAASLMLVTLFATFLAMEVFQTNNARTTDLIGFIDHARNTTGRLTRDLRGATASSATSVPGGSVLLRAGAQDLVMKRVEPSRRPSADNMNAVQTVRWCLAQGALHRQVADGSAEPASTCPDTTAAWTDSIVATQIANGARAVFTYDSATVELITTVSTFLAVDRNPAKPPVEATLSSGVFLRNQNRAPHALFSFVALGGHNIQLNAQASRDPEGGILTYEWREGAVLLPYSNAVASYVALAGGARPITLTVRDREGLAASQTMTVDVLP